MSTTEENQAEGILELHARGHGQLRDPAKNFRVAPQDPTVSASLISKHSLEQGARVKGVLQRGRAPAIEVVLEIEGALLDKGRNPRSFDDLTPIDPPEQIILETGPQPIGPRVIDMLIPIGKGQRGLIVAPPRSGKTILIQQIAAAVATNYPAATLIVLLVDERPEEVTEMRRSVKGQVFYSSNDRDTEEHIRIAQLAIDRAKRIAEAGGDAIVLLDSLTRLARAHNKMSNTGRTMTGGVDVKALDAPKRVFGSARAFAEGGSLTVMATALIDTGSKMDELIFQEFKGTGNSELILDRKLAERRVWPAIDILQSGTRKEERLLDPETFRRVTLLRQNTRLAKGWRGDGSAHQTARENQVERRVPGAYWPVRGRG